jgi:NAD(P)-dependent dehydrogenase (short-subunit alcohol dehydrogenase family)
VSRVAWVTGASRGIGAAVAREFVSRGYAVGISSRSEQQLQRVAGAAGGRVLVVPADVTDRDAMLAAAARVRDELGPIDVAVLNAAHWGQMSVAAWDSALFRRHLDTNLVGMVHGIEAVLADMRRRRSGTIAGLASVAGYRGLPRSEAYGATKAAQINMLESLRIDLAPAGVRVITVCPGFVRTDLTAGNTFPMPWIMEPEEAARRICDGIERGRAEVVFPLGMMLAMKAARLVPVRLWAWGFARVPQRSAATTGADSAAASGERP